MYEYNYAAGHYMISFYYIGKKYTYKIAQYHIDRRHTYWHLFHKGGIEELKYTSHTQTLEHLVQHGQTPFPPDFLKAVQLVFIEIHKG
jgi:hypothetical protein